MDTLEIMRQAVTKELGRDLGELTLETSFEDMQLDSLEVVQMIMAIEEAFDIEIADEDVDGFKKVGQLVEYIEEKTR